MLLQYSCTYYDTHSLYARTHTNAMKGVELSYISWMNNTQSKKERAEKHPGTRSVRNVSDKKHLQITACHGMQYLNFIFDMFIFYLFMFLFLRIYLCYLCVCMRTCNVVYFILK